MSETQTPVHGGQAVIEGVMMRGRVAYAIAMRNPEGEIELHSEKLSAIYQKKAARIPFVRGLILLWDALVLGTKALTISANVQSEEEEQLDGTALAFTLLGSLAIAITLFFLAPAGVGFLSERYLALPNIWGSLLEGLVRLLILIGYLWGIARMEDIDRVYRYHGAEHKTINAFEAGVELTPDNVEQFPREHPRCGTAFLLTVVVLSILIFALIGPLPLLPRLGLRVLLIPLLASLAYEYLRWTAKHMASPLVRWLVIPNLALQRLTTRPPDKAMLEVAIASFNEMRRLEDALESA